MATVETHDGCDWKNWITYDATHPWRVDGRMLYLKNGTSVTYLKDSTKYRTLKSIASAD